MHSFNIFFPYMTEEELEAMEKPSTENTELPAFNAEINKVVDVLFPIDNVTHNPTSAVNTLISPTASQLDKEKYASMMQKVPTDRSNKDLDDETIMATTPSRKNQTLTDMDKYAGAVASYAELTGMQNGKEAATANTEPSTNVSAESGTSSAE
nr:MAG TPA: hypothetical protein [Microviridae sp. cttdF6]